jgi:5-oxoprolinase (ATP-hydrolysing) subunit A
MRSVRSTIDVNADVGEGFDTDAELLGVVSSANVACGFHAGDIDTMRACCDLAVRHGVAVGAQVSYRDREGFGRRDVEIAPDRLLDDIEEQIAALRDAARPAGADVRYLKPHGALYNRVVWDGDQADSVVEAARRHGLAVLGLPGSTVLARARAAGVPAYREFFADRGYTSDGRLLPRTEPGAVVDDADDVAGRIRRLVADGSVVSVDGVDVAADADSVCVHGDTPGAVGLARRVRAALEDAGCSVRPFT